MIKEEIDKIESQKQQTKGNQTKSWFFGKVNKIDKKWREKPQTKEEMKKEKAENHAGIL